jgi:ATP-dependent Zn protease
MIMRVIDFLIFYCITLGILMFITDRCVKFYCKKRNDNMLAVHEAGHAISLWWCSAIKYLMHITIIKPDGGGEVRYMHYYLDDNNSDLLWCELVIALGGLAGELVVIKKFSTTPATKDLMVARETAAKLEKLNTPPPPWKEIQVTKPTPFQDFYTAPLTPAELSSLNQAFEYAKYLIKTRIDDHKKIVSKVLKLKTLTEEQTMKLLGSRDEVRDIGKTEQFGFHLPK